MAVLVGLDLGTTEVKAVAYDAEVGRVVRAAARPTPVSNPGPGLSEHSPEALWQVAAACLSEVSAQLLVAGLAIASFAEAGLPVDAAGQPLYPIIAWHDRRSAPQAARWEARLGPEGLHAITGQKASPSFGVTKWLWLRDNEPDLADRMAQWLSAPDYVLWRLTGEYATDFSLASRTLLFDQRRLAWSPALLDLAQLRPEQLPRALPSGTRVGGVTAGASKESGLPVGTVCVLGGHDHLCAALAAGAYAPGTCVDSSGTAEAVVMVLPKFVTAAALAVEGYACYAHVAPEQFVLKGGLKAAGGAVEWLACQLSGSSAAPTGTDYEALALAAEPGIGQRAGPIWLPHWLGSGTPQGDAHSLAAMVGVRLDHGPGDLFRGLLESLAFWLRQNLEHMQVLAGQTPTSVFLLGGTTRLRLLPQLKADVLKLPVNLPGEANASAIGAALLAGLGVGLFASLAEAVASRRDGVLRLTPDPTRAAWYDRLYAEAYLPLYEALRPVHQALE